MKHIILTLLITVISFSFSYGQEEAIVKEIGLTTSNLNNFGFTYRKGKENRVFRINAISTSLGEDERIFETNVTNKTEYSDFGFRISIGKEWRSTVKEKLEMRYGLDLGYRYSTSKQEVLDDITQTQVITETINKYNSAGINMVIGFNFLLSDGFLLGGEILPGYSFYNTNSTVKTFEIETSSRDDSGSGFGFSTSGVRLSFLYRF